MGLGVLRGLGMNNCIDSRVSFNVSIRSIVYVYIMIIIVIVLSLIIFLLLYHYKTYYRVNGTIIYDGDSYIMRVFVPIDDISYFTSNNDLIIDSVSYKYSIISIDNDYYTDNMSSYVVFCISFDVPSNYKYNNFTCQIKLLKENKRVIDYFI